ncbi:MAG: YdcF family protein [Alphaproteobacteria bacterium]|nr:YdcF family protein [Alphaproteobacteria bacterium]
MTFFLSKFLWMLISPGSLLALLLAAGLVMRLVPCACTRRLSGGLIVLVSLAMLAIAVLPVGDWALTPLEDRFANEKLPDHVDGIVVIGGDEQAAISEFRGVPVALDSMRRYMTVAMLAKRYPDAKLVFSGGPVYPRPGTRIVDADVARDAMAAMGVPAERMIFEKESRNTYENATDAAAIVHPQPGENWVLVTSAWHMPRAMGCFRQAGWHVFAAPTGYFTMGHYRVRFMFRFDDELRMLTFAVHEYIGLVAYSLMGRTDALWPG